MVRPQDRGQQDFQLDHCILPTHTTPGSSAERYEAVVVPVLCALRQEVVRIEGLGIRINVFASMNFVGADDDRAASGQHVFVRGEVDVFVELPGNDRNRWIHSQSLEDDTFQVLHFHAVGKRAFAIGRTEDGLQFGDYLVLDVLVDGQQAECEAGSGSRCVVTLDDKRDWVILGKQIFFK